MRGRCAEMEPMFRTRPRLRGFMRRKASRVQRNAPVRHAPITLSHASSDNSSTGPPSKAPALLISRSTGPNSWSVSAKSRCTSASRETSQATEETAAAVSPSWLQASCSRSEFRPASMTRQPAATSEWAMPRPIPVEPPVTMAVWPVRSNKTLSPVRISIGKNENRRLDVRSRSPVLRVKRLTGRLTDWIFRRSS